MINIKRDYANLTLNVYILDDVFEDQIFELPRSHQDSAKAPHLCSTVGAEQISEARKSTPKDL